MPNKPIELTPEDLKTLLERVKAAVSEEDYETIKAMTEVLQAMSQVVDQKAASIKRLLKQLFGQKSEKKKDVLNDQDNEENPDNKPDMPGKKPKGHGRNGASAYTGVKRVQINHEDLKQGAFCPLCLKGKVYRKSPGTVLRIVGSPPLGGTLYEMEKFRCNLCGETFTAKLPEDIGEQKYDETATAIIALLKYGNGFPFYRLAQLQKNLGVPVPATTQWGLLVNSSSSANPLIRKC